MSAASYGEATPRTEEFHEKLRALISEYIDVTGPFCRDAECDHTDEVGIPLPQPDPNNLMLGGYILSTHWDDIASSVNNNYTDYFVSPGVSFTTVMGLALITYKELESLI